MFGDNLSIVSDTTIASVMSQEANLKAKFQLNAKIAFLSSIITILILFFNSNNIVETEAQDYSLILIIPYILLIILASSGINVFVSLVTSLAVAGVIGVFVKQDYSFLNVSQDITKGFAGMQEIMLLSLMVGGLSGLAGKSSAKLAHQLSA